MASILIAGCGALGSVFGGFLRRAGHRVTLLGRPSHLDAIRRSGLRIEGLWGDHVVEGFELLTEAPRAGCFDAILITVKSFDTSAMGRSVLPLLSAEGVLISLQNGLGNVEELVDLAGRGRVIGGRVIFGAVIPEPGCVRVTVFAEPTLLGAWPGSKDTEATTARAQFWAEEFSRVGVPAEFCPDIEAALWGKVFYSAALNPLGALLGCHYGALPEHADSREIMDRVMDEAFAVARAEGVSLPWESADEYRQVFYERLVPSTYDHRSSMLQDLERGRRTEIDAINGAVWKRARAHGMEAAANEMLTRLLHAREVSQRG